MLRLRTFLLEWFHLLVIGDALAGRIARWVSWAIGFGIWKALREPLHLLVWTRSPLMSVPPKYQEPSVGLCLVIALAIIYVSVAAGAAWTRSSTLRVLFRHPACADCWPTSAVRLEVWNGGAVKPIDDIHVFLDSIEPGQIARRELGWVGQGRGGITLLARAHAHLEFLAFDQMNNCFLQIGPPQQLQPGVYFVRLTVESKVGSLPVRILINPSGSPPVKIVSCL